jgi:ATP-dependent helicase/nuclease subunit A
LLDFKTGRYPAGDASELPTAFLRQMAHYTAALESIFPGRQVEASLLFTEGPELVLLPDNLLAPFKPAS